MKATGTTVACANTHILPWTWTSTCLFPSTGSVCASFCFHW